MRKLIAFVAILSVSLACSFDFVVTDKSTPASQSTSNKFFDQESSAGLLMGDPRFWLNRNINWILRQIIAQESRGSCA